MRFIKNIIIFTFLIFLLPITLSWSQKTHESFVTEVCHKFSECTNLGCWKDIRNGSYYPISFMRDYEGKVLYRQCENANNQLWCYDDCEDCTNGEQFFDRTALNRMDGYVSQASANQGCSRFFSVGIASFYFLESKEFWNHVKGEKKWCVDPFEEGTEREITNDFSVDWTVENCGITVRGSDMVEWLDEFVLLIKDATGADIISISHPNPEQTSSVTKQSTQDNNLKCVLSEIKYLNKLCSASSTVEDFGRKKGIDTFNVLFVLVIIFFLYIIIFRRR